MSLICGAEDTEVPVRLSCTLDLNHEGLHRDDRYGQEWSDR